MLTDESKFRISEEEILIIEKIFNDLKKRSFTKSLSKSSDQFQRRHLT